MLNRAISPFAFKWESHAAEPGGSPQPWEKLALSHSKGRAEASSYQKLLVLSLEKVTGAGPDFTILHELMIWGTSNWSLRTKWSFNVSILCAFLGRQKNLDQVTQHYLNVSQATFWRKQRKKIALWQSGLKYLHFSSNPSHKEKHPEGLGISCNFTMLFGWLQLLSVSPQRKGEF